MTKKEKGLEDNKRVLRAIVVSGDKEIEKFKSAAEDTDHNKVGFSEAKWIEPPYEPEVLAMLPENSSELVQCIEAMEVNIEGFGQRVIQREMEESTENENTAEIKKERNELKGLLQLTNSEDNMTALRRKTRKDIEIQGNGYWEILTSPTGALVSISYLKAKNMRIVKQDEEFTEITKRYLDEDFKWVNKKFFKKFRRFVQVVGTKRVWFKEWDDPRVIDKRTGKVLKKPSMKDKTEFGATGVMWFKIQSGRTTYGLPRMIGNLFSIFGSRSSDVINYQTFRNNNVPSMIVTVSNGMLTDHTIERIEEYVNSSIKRSDNWSKFLILEAETQDEEVQQAGAMKIDVKPLQATQHRDQLFQEYDENNSEKLRRSFRLPNIFVGKTENINRACYSEDTETLTENGWKYYHEIGEDEKIATFNPETKGLEYHLPIGGLKLYDYEGEMLHFANRNSDILVTPDHKMWASSYVVDDWKKVEAKDVTDIAKILRFRSSPDFYQPEFSETTTIDLDTLKNTDGIINSVDSWTYETISPALADQVQILALQLGHRANINVSVDSRGENRKPLFRVNITEDKPTFKITDHQIESEFYKGKVYCYEVPNHLFVTRRNGKVAIQGNTTEASRRLAEEQVFAPEREEMDRQINNLLLAFGFKFHQIKSNSPNVTDDAALTKILSGSEKTGALTPNLSREIIGDILNKEMPKLEKTDKFDPDVPFSLTMAEAVKKRDGLAPNQGQLGEGEGRNLNPDEPEPKDDPEPDDSTTKQALNNFFSFMDNPATEFDKDIGITVFADVEDDDAAE